VIPAVLSLELLLIRR